MKFRMYAAGQSAVFEADEIQAGSEYIMGKKDDKIIALVSKANVFCVIPEE